MKAPWGLDGRHRWDDGLDVLGVPFRRVYTCYACNKSVTVSTDRIVPDSFVDALVSVHFARNPYRDLFREPVAV